VASGIVIVADWITPGAMAPASDPFDCTPQDPVSRGCRETDKEDCLHARQSEEGWQPYLGLHEAHHERDRTVGQRDETHQTEEDADFPFGRKLLPNHRMPPRLVRTQLAETHVTIAPASNEFDWIPSVSVHGPIYIRGTGERGILCAGLTQQRVGSIETLSGKHLIRV